MSTKPITPKAIKATRERLKETQETFSRRFGVDQSTLHRWETEGVPNRGPARVAIERVLSDLSSEKAA
jgi:DNA-binding transcriptional regulator YiaG